VACAGSFLEEPIILPVEGSEMSTAVAAPCSWLPSASDLLGRAFAEFLEGTDGVVRDESRERPKLTFNPGGYLKKRETTIGDAPNSSSLHGRLWRQLQIRRCAHGSAKIGHAAKLVGPPGCVTSGKPDQYVL
jgi:hypothetical protein